MNLQELRQNTSSKPKLQEDAQCSAQKAKKEHSDAQQESKQSPKVYDDGGVMTSARYGGGAHPEYRDEKGTVVCSVLGTGKLKRMQVQTAQTKKRRTQHGTKKHRAPSSAQQSKCG